VGFYWVFGDEDHPWGLMIGGLHDNEGGGKALYVNLGKSFTF
jgi:hypothetical protein